MPSASSDDVSEGWRYRGWLVVAASLIALAFGPSTVAVMSLGLFIVPIEKDFGWPRTDVALATTIVSYTIVVVSPLQGYLIDRFGARRILLPSIPAFALGVAALSMLPAVHWIYYAAWVMIPILGIGLFPLGYLRIVGGWFRHRLGLAMGLANAGVGIGGTIIPYIVGATISAASWRHAYLLLGVIVLVLTLPVVWMFLREKTQDSDTVTRAADPSGLTMRQAARTRAFKLLVLVFALLGIINTALIVHQAPLLIDAGLSSHTAANVMIAFGLAQLAGRLMTGFLLDRVAAPAVMIVFALGASAACALYAAQYGAQLAFLCSILLGLAFGAEFDVLAYLVKQRFGLKAFGKLYGLIFAVFQFGAGCGAAFLPVSRDWAGGSYAPGLWAFAVMSAAAAATLSFMPRAFLPPAHASFQRLEWS